MGHLFRPHDTTAIAYLGASRRFSLERLGGLGLGLGVVMGTAFAAASLPWMVPLAREFGLPLPLVLLVLASVPALLLRSFLNATLLVANRVGHYNAVELATPACFLVAFVAGWLGFDLVRGDSSADWIALGVWARVLAVFGALGLALVFAGQIYRLRPRFEGEILRESWKTARWAYSYSLLSELNARFGFVILIPAVLAHSALLPEAVKHELGRFGTTLAFADILRALLAVELILFAEIAGERERSREITPVVSRLIAALGACAVLGAYAGAPLLLWVVNADYLAALPALFVLLPGVVALAVAKALSADLFVRGQERWILGNHLLGFCAISLVHVLAVSRLGALGMALGLTVGYCLQAARALVRYSRVAGVPARELVLPTRADWARVWGWVRRTGIGTVESTRVEE